MTAVFRNEKLTPRLISSKKLFEQFNFYAVARDLNGKVFGYSTMPREMKRGWGTQAVGPVVELTHIFLVQDMIPINNWKKTLIIHPAVVEERNKNLKSEERTRKVMKARKMKELQTEMAKSLVSAQAVEKFN